MLYSSLKRLKTYDFQSLEFDMRVPLAEQGEGLEDKAVKQFAGEVRKTIEAADIIIEVAASVSF